MAKIFLLFGLAFFFLTGCGTQSDRVGLENELNQVRTELAVANEQLAVLQQDKPDSTLMHTLFFSLREDLSAEEKTELIQKMKSLSEIEVAHRVTVGEPANTGDPRLATGYQLVLQMEFNSQTDLDTYQQHPHHLAVKTDTKDFFAGKPLVYDYWVK